MALTILTGCGRTVKVHLIDKEDFIEVEKGETYTTDRDGYFLSDYALEEIAQARLD